MSWNPLVHKKPVKGGFRNIKDYVKESVCLDSAHNPPGHIALPPGLWEYTCPSCGHVTTLDVPLITC